MARFEGCDDFLSWERGGSDNESFRGGESQRERKSLRTVEREDDQEYLGEIEREGNQKGNLDLLNNIPRGIYNFTSNI